MLYLKNPVPLYFVRFLLLIKTSESCSFSPELSRDLPGLEFTWKLEVSWQPQSVLSSLEV